jgi:hypothetical protein
MIWSTTTHVGMAFATSPSGATYVVARYSPPGNTVGESPQQGTTRGREGNPSTNAFPPYNRPPTSTKSSNAHRKDSRYGQNRHLGPQSRYHGRRGHENVLGNNEGPLHSSQHPLTRPPPSSHRMHVSYTDPRFRSPYGHSRGPGPYGSGAPWSYASAMAPVGYGGHRSRGSSASLCCTVM